MKRFSFLPCVAAIILSVVSPSFVQAESCYVRLNGGFGLDRQPKKKTMGLTFHCSAPTPRRAMPSWAPSAIAFRRMFVPKVKFRGTTMTLMESNFSSSMFEI